MDYLFCKTEIDITSAEISLRISAFLFYNDQINGNKMINRKKNVIRLGYYILCIYAML